MTSALAWLDSRGGRVLAGLALFYTVFGLWVLTPEVFYSGDIGIKYVQARALVDHRFTSLDIPYPGEFLDRDGIFPCGPPFIIVTSGLRSRALPASSVLQAVAVGAAPRLSPPVDCGRESLRCMRPGCCAQALLDAVAFVSARLRCGFTRSLVGTPGAWAGRGGFAWAVGRAAAPAVSPVCSSRRRHLRDEVCSSSRLLIALWLRREVCSPPWRLAA